MGEAQQSVGRYQIIELLGQGSMGRVYLALDPKLRREVAVKLLHDHVAADDSRRRMFHREARAAAALEHPNVVKVYDYSGPEESRQYLVLQRLRGVDLGTVLDTLASLPEKLVVALAYEVTLALEHMHGQNVVHRDLKPDNLFLEPDGRVVVGDFGIAKALEAPDALGGTMIVEKSQLMGTPLYMAPEQLVKSESGPASDLFSLGAVMFHLMAGVPPFAGRGQELMARIARGRVRYLRNIDPSISVSGAAFVHSLLVAEPAARPTASDAKKQLRHLLSEHGESDTRELCTRFFYEPEQVAAELRQAQLLRQRQRETAPAAATVSPAPVAVATQPETPPPRSRRRHLLAALFSALFGVACGVGLLLALR
jgi:serine/threonine-protein kinase